MGYTWVRIHSISISIKPMLITIIILTRIVDLHSHLGVDSAPALSGASDTNSILGIAQPWLRSLDGLNTHDDAYALSISGGVTSANVLPGSANAIGIFM